MWDSWRHWDTRLISAPRPGLRSVVGGISLSLAGAVLGLLLLPDTESAWASRPVQLRLARQTVALPETPTAPDTADERFLAQARTLARAYLDAKVTLLAGSERLELSRAALGVRVDVVHLAELLAAAHDPRSVLRRLHHQLHTETDSERALVLPMPASLDHAQALPWIVRLKDAVDRAPVDARIDVQRTTVVASRPGIQLDVYGTLEAIDRALPQGQARLQAAVYTVQAGRQAASLENLDLGAVLGSYETPYQQSRKHADRTHNLRVAARKVDGWIVAPGEVFDFNQAVGPRSEAGGFRPAPVIAEGELVDGLGGGTCQIASTLHAAAYFAGLPIVTRQPHSRPSYYIKLGLDAAVAYDQLNFRFRNDLPFPLVIGIRVQDGFVRAELKGARRDRRVSFVRRIEHIRPFEERVDPDPELPSGLRVLAQRGVPGFEVSRTRIIVDTRSGEERREQTRDVYPPTTQRWRVGTSSKLAEGFRLPENDAHPEYVVDEYLSMTQGPDQPGFEEERRAGRTGSLGWTVREGFAPEAAAQR